MICCFVYDSVMSICSVFCYLNLIFNMSPVNKLVLKVKPVSAFSADFHFVILYFIVLTQLKKCISVI